MLRGLHCGPHCFGQEAKPEKPSWLHLPSSCCHLPLQEEREKEWGKRDFELQRVIFIWNMTGTFYLGKRKEKYISYKTDFIKRFELVIALTLEQGLNSDHSCLNVALKLSWRSWILLVKGPGFICSSKSKWQRRFCFYQTKHPCPKASCIAVSAAPWVTLWNLWGLHLQEPAKPMTRGNAHSSAVRTVTRPC